MFDDLYSNIGRKIKILAKVIALIGTIFWIIFGFILVLVSLKLTILSIFCIIGGPILSWISSFTLYGFGELVENSDILAKSKQKIKDDIKKISKDNLPSPIEHKIPENENVFILDENKSPNSTPRPEISKEILDFIELKLNNVSKTTIKNIKQEFSIWHKSLHSMTDKELISILETPSNWQEEYILLCCIELKQRNQDI